MTKSSSKQKGSGLSCSYCDRPLSYQQAWKFTDGQDGFVCTATHMELGGNVAFFEYYIDNEGKWAIRPRN